MAEGGIHGSITSFNSEQEEWVDYVERVEKYFIANTIDGDGKKCAILLNGVGASTYRLIKTLALPKTLKELKFDEIMALVSLHFNPKPSTIVSRFEFNTRCQKEGESVSSFVAALRKLTEHFNYGAVLDEMLRDRIVCGIRNKKTQQRLLQEADLTYSKAYDLALAAETAQKNSYRLDQSMRLVTLKEADGEDAIHRVRGDKTPSQPRRQSGESAPRNNLCFRCGGRHPHSQCWYKEYICNYCKKKGHLASVCMKKGERRLNESGRREQTNVVMEEQDNEQDEKYEEYTLYQVSNGSSKPLMVPVQINGEGLEMELDKEPQCRS